MWQQPNWLLLLPQLNPTRTRTPNLPPSFASYWPKRPLLPWHPPLYMSLLPPSSYTLSLKDLDREGLILCLYTLDSQHDQPRREAKSTSTAPLECMSTKAIVSTLHHSDTSPPAICPCDTPNASDTKYHFTAEELHQLTGCCQFRNYCHLIHTSKDGQFLDSDKFPISIGAYTTIRGSTRKNVIFSNSLWTNSEYPISLKSMSI